VGILLPINEHLSHLIEKFSDTFRMLLLSFIYLFLDFYPLSIPIISLHRIDMKLFELI